MKSEQAEIRRDLVLAGGGHTHVGVLRMLAMQPIPGVRVTLVSKGGFAPYSGMLPGYLAGHYAWDQALIDLRKLCRFAGAQFYPAEVTGIDLENRRLHCADRPSIHYDLLSLNTGSTPTLSGEGVEASESLIPVKPLESFLHAWPGVIEQVCAAEGRFRIVVVGSGAGGVELALASQYGLSRELKRRGLPTERLEMHLVSASASLLPSHNRNVQRIFSRVFAERGITVHLDHSAVGVKDRVIRCEPGAEVPYDIAFWVTHAAPAPWIAASGLDTDERGFIALNACLQSTSDPRIFAAGDMASVSAHPRPRAGVFAVRQAAPLTENLERALGGEALEPFTPQKRFLSILTTGNRYAVASRGGFSLEGAWVWKWKNFIDLRWIRKYQELPQMEEETPEGVPGEEAFEQMRCGGCGSKIGKVLLSNVLARLDPKGREDVHIGLQEPDDAAVLRVPEGKVLVQSVDGFRAFLNDPYVFGQIAAEHALSDLFAMGAEPSSAQVNVAVPVGRAGVNEEQLYQLMAGILQVLDRHGVALVGGHTVEGEALEAGLVVNGFARMEELLTKDGAQAGDRILLSKPLGTGTLLAAEMRYQADGKAVEEALDLMRVSNREAVDVLRKHQVTALTDVTGFGLCGHLLEMLEPAGLDAALRAEAVPVLAGALQTAAAGILSSLQPENERLAAQVEAADTVRSSGRWPLFFDPQTSGGLLATVPESEARAAREALRAGGYPHAEIIGTVVPLKGHESSIHIQ